MGKEGGEGEQESEMQVATVICFDTMTASRWREGTSQSSTDRDGGAAITAETHRAQHEGGVDNRWIYLYGSMFEVWT